MAKGKARKKTAPKAKHNGWAKVIRRKLAGLQVDGKFLAPLTRSQDAKVRKLASGLGIKVRMEKAGEKFRIWRVA